MDCKYTPKKLCKFNNTSIYKGTYFNLMAADRNSKLSNDVEGALYDQCSSDAQIQKSEFHCQAEDQDLQNLSFTCTHLKNCFLE